jgi:hypothetical protein
MGEAQEAVIRNSFAGGEFNAQIELPFALRIEDFRLAIQDVYDFFFDVNSGLVAKGLERLDDTLRPAIMSGVLSDMLTASLAKHSRTLVVNGYFDGHGCVSLSIVSTAPQNRRHVASRWRSPRSTLGKLASPTSERTLGANSAREPRHSTRQESRNFEGAGCTACRPPRRSDQIRSIDSSAKRGSASHAIRKYASSRSTPMLE